MYAIKPEEQCITIAPGVIVTVRDHQVVRVATCGSRAAAEDAVVAFVDAERPAYPGSVRSNRFALGYEQAIERGMAQDRA